MKNNIDNINNLQKYLIGWFMEYWYAQDYQDIIPSKLFGIYEKLFLHLCKNWISKTPDFYALCSEIWVKYITEAMDMSDSSFVTSRDKYIEKLLDIYVTGELSKQLSPMEVLDKTKEIYAKLEHVKLWTTGGISKIDNLLFSLQDEIEEAISYGDKKVWYSTGIQLIDKYTWWVIKGRTIRVSAYSNVGKSSLSYWIANSILRQWAKVVYFSLEIPKSDLRDRLLSNYYKISIEKFSKKSTLENFDMSEYAEKQLYVCTDVFTISEIERITQTIKPDVIFIDYIQLVKWEWSTEYEQMNDVARRIRKLTEENNVACFDLSQVWNEDAKYKKGGKIPAKWSGELVSAASQVFVMSESNFPWKVNICLAKNRHWVKWVTHEFTPDFLTCSFNNEQVAIESEKTF